MDKIQEIRTKAEKQSVKDKAVRAAAQIMIAAWETRIFVDYELAIEELVKALAEAGEVNP